jgi:hypothetical protein
MKRKLLLTAALFAAGLGALPAQQISNDATPLYRNVSIHLGGINVPPIAGAPFSATAVVEEQQQLPDGTTETKRTINLVGRDARGRTHGENRNMVTESFQGMPQLNEVHLFDPQTRLQVVYEPATHIARRNVRREPPGLANPQGSMAQRTMPQVRVEDLGATVIDNIDVKGTRRTLTIPAQFSSTGAPLTVVDEYWYSEDLHVNVLLRHNDPRTGLQTIALSDLKREEPPQSFFEVPAGYKIVDMTPPPGAPVERGRAPSGSPVP